jgi:hypothetical protein
VSFLVGLRRVAASRNVAKAATNRGLVVGGDVPADRR